MENKLSVTLKNDTAEVASLNKIVEEFAGNHNLSDKTVFNLNIALEEFITNIIKYGYDDDKEHLIKVNISMVGDELITVIEDDGNFFNPLEAPEPDIDKPAEEIKIGGLGIHLVRNLAGQLKYERKNNKNIVLFKIKKS